MQHLQRTAAIAERARHQAARTYALVPARVKLAVFLIATSVDPFLKSWGKTVYAAFLLAGVEGMPPIQVDLDRLKKNPNFLPAGYGDSDDFAKKVYHSLVGKTKIRRPGFEDDILHAMNVTAANLFRERRFLEGKTLDQARAYTATSATNALIAVWQSNRRQMKKDQVTDYPEGDIEDRRDPAVDDAGSLDPDDLADIHEELLNLKIVPKWMNQKALPGIVDMILKSEFPGGDAGIKTFFIKDMFKDHGVPYPMKDVPAANDIEQRTKDFKRFQAQGLPLIRKVIAPYLGRAA